MASLYARDRLGEAPARSNFGAFVITDLLKMLLLAQWVQSGGTPDTRRNH